MAENMGAGRISFAPDRSIRYLAEYARVAAVHGAQAAQSALLGELAGQSSQDWLECGQALVVRGDIGAAAAVFEGAVAAHPDSAELRHALAGVLWQTGKTDAAECELCALLARHPDNVASCFLLAKILKEQGRMHAVAGVMRTLFAHARPSTEVVIRAVELLDDCARKQDAADLCENEIAAGSTDPRVHAYAGMLGIQVGQFERARERYLFALANSPLAADWQAPNGLSAAQRYTEASHPDFELFRNWLQRPALSERGRASLLFALGKAHDDLGEPEQAADYFRQGNRVVSGITEWSAKSWRRIVTARLDAKPLPRRVRTADDCVPVFIVGMPRSGSTLVAELLSRHADVCHRGELTWLPFLAQQIALAGKPTEALLEKTATTYLTQLRQDDSRARWFIDKQPLNFLHVDLIAALFPNAKIIHCERNGRDTALSVWMQYFAGHEENFAYDFANIAAVMQGCSRLMANARKNPALPIRGVRYERLVTDSRACLEDLAGWLGLPGFDFQEGGSDAAAISTSSLWQVRQPVYTRSIGRWKAYAPYLPELLQFPNE
ncbi:tetratricopeptide repeat-containing sulfotransferase family protein [Dokdonella soli]|uniref:Tetratricopeptide repeat-containing sulfotransferase family protein n=1 Tax=Dokdonella soli TaxID=529810 RepID=A0ABN1IJL0_9GAMM